MVIGKVPNAKRKSKRHRGCTKRRLSSDANKKQIDQRVFTQNRLTAEATIVENKSRKERAFQEQACIFCVFFGFVVYETIKIVIFNYLLKQVSFLSLWFPQKVSLPGIGESR